MSLAILESFPRSRLKALLEHFAAIDDPREPWRVAHPLPEVLLLVVCGTICDGEDYDVIAAWGKANLPVLRRYAPYHHGVPGGRWLTLLMNRVDRGLFAAVFTDWVRATWPDRPDFVAIDGKTSRRSHDRAAGTPPLHLVSAFATTARLVLGQEAVPDKASETTAIPVLIERLAASGGLAGALVTIDAIATNPAIAATIRAAGAHYLLAVKANQPTLRAEVERFFDDARPAEVDIHRDLDKGHGRIEERIVTVAREVDWLDGQRRFPGETRLPDVASLIRIQGRTELKDRCRFETRYYVSSAPLTAAKAGEAVRGHWAIENSLHWVLDVAFDEDRARDRRDHGPENLATLRKLALNVLRSARPDISIRRKRKRSGWSDEFARSILGQMR
jgi:predicted transposase YbfD/YdcC